MLKYRIDVMQELADMGYKPQRIRDESLISQQALTKIRAGEMVGIHTLDVLCELLELQPGQIIKWYPNDDE